MKGCESAAELLRRVLLSYLVAVTVEYLMLPPALRALTTTDGIAHMSALRVIVITCAGVAVLCALSRTARTRTAERWGIATVLAVLAVAAAAATAEAAFAAACLLCVVLAVVYAARGWCDAPYPTPAPRRTGAGWVMLTATVTAAFFALLVAWSVGRVYAFHTPTYDFGIFSQMFHYMRTRGVPLTTLERDGLLSHFAVHVSPIYYLMLPFYALFPSPVTLQVLQAAVLASAVIPLWHIGKHHGLRGAPRTLLCALLLLYPAFGGGIGYDLHENCFLTPLLLWLFYGIDRGSVPIAALAAVLTLTVKEDAAVYVAVIALWLIVRTALHFRRDGTRQLVLGIVLLLGAVGYFACVTGYLAAHGDGVMTYRYANMMPEGASSLTAVIRAALLHPALALFECVDAEKLCFIALTLAPLLGLPLLTRRYERYLLLIPYVLVNLLSDYPYQHDIYFQYTFGSLACLFYLTTVNLADMRHAGRRMLALLAALAVSAACFAQTVAPRALSHATQALDGRDAHQSIRDTLDTIPEGASVAATTFHTTYLAARRELYDIYYCSWEQLSGAEYVVLSLSDMSAYHKYATGGRENGYARLMQRLMALGYIEHARLDNVLVILRRG